MAQKPSLPKGTRDFTPSEVIRRNYIMDVIRNQFKLFGFAPIETPSFENYDTLMGKYGEEGDRLIFKILNSGDYLKKANQEALKEQDSQKLTSSISEKALRYDLTVPFARYVVQHQNEIDFPFKRYQIQPVWRADRPQKGRFREFFQCDADVVGSNSLLQEVELIQLYDAVFSDLGLNGVTIKLNNRKILSGIAEVIGASEFLIDFTVALDKLDKIGKEKVIEEMLSKGISQSAVQMADPLFSISGTSLEQLASLKEFLKNSTLGTEGVNELEFILQSLENTPLKTASIQIEVTLARGLNYYTGAIIEVGAPEGVQMGSIGGGGRYDDLTSIFGLKNVGGVGISFGLDRIYLVLEELDLFPATIASAPKVFFVNFGDQEAQNCIKLIQQLRAEGVSAELYPSSAKMQKQMKYANNRNYPFVVLLGEQELNDQTVVVKNMGSGDQQTVSQKELVGLLK
ncbi:MAG: histidine--tRNA ligase [Flavobacteriaceae bacterium]|jgi:histidyl-tRNA synthetase|nr:histidine--tRNA ligase [Flavobacteriaceae bacterium]